MKGYVSLNIAAKFRAMVVGQTKVLKTPTVIIMVMVPTVPYLMNRTSLGFDDSQEKLTGGLFVMPSKDVCSAIVSITAGFKS